MDTLLLCLGLALLAVIGVLADQLPKILKRRHELKLRKLEVRELEAQAKLGAKKRAEKLPGFLDPEDPDDVEAYREASKELMEAHLRRGTKN